MAVLLCLATTSCQDEIGVVEPGNPGTPAVDVQGDYSGNWTRTLDGKTQNATGTISFTAGETNHVVNVRLYCPELKVDFNTVANIAKNNEGGYVFANQEASKNGLGATFSGRIKDGNANIKFTLAIKEGRKKYLYDYTFDGNK